jgi:hypothetical protein
MPAVRGPIPNRPQRRLALLAAGRRAATMAALLLAGLIGWSLHSPGTKTVIRTIQRPPATIYQDTPAGAVAAAARALNQAASGPPQSGHGELNYSGDLLYRVKQYSPSSAVIETWHFAIAAGNPLGVISDWSLSDVQAQWTGSEWRADGRMQTQVADATPPPNGTTGERSRAFGALLSDFRRFPGAP